MQKIDYLYKKIFGVGKTYASATAPKSRRLRLETLENREMLSASSLGDDGDLNDLNSPVTSSYTDGQNYNHASYWIRSYCVDKEIVGFLQYGLPVESIGQREILQPDTPGGGQWTRRLII